MDTSTYPHRKAPPTARELHDAAIVSATVNAPAWVLRRLQADRRECGLPELRGRQFANLAERARPARRAGLGVIVGTCTYGPSRPVHCDWDKRSIVEHFTADAFSSSVEEIRNGFRSAWLSMGHAPDAVATTDDGTLSLSVHPVVGLCFWARLDASDEARRICERVRAGKIKVSVGFTPEQFESEPYRLADGTKARCRIIRRAQLSHIALIDVAGGSPCYPATCVHHTFSDSDQAIAGALHNVREASKKARAEYAARRS